MDTLEDLLGPGDGSPSPRREAMRRATTRRVHFALWARRTRWAVLLGAAYLAGVFTPWARPEPTMVPVIVPMVTPAESPEPTVPILARLSPSRLEMAAEEAMPRPAESARLYREAGDLYLSEAGDIASAARCYRLYLAAAMPPERVPVPADNWLMFSMKSELVSE